MSQFASFQSFIRVTLFFIKVILGMALPLISWTVLDRHWWEEEWIIIPILLFEDAVISFYFVYWFIRKLNFPLGVFSIVPVMYGAFVPLVAIFFVTIGEPFILFIANSIFHSSAGVVSVNGVTIILFFSSVIALMLTCIFTGGFLKIHDRSKGQSRLIGNHRD